MVLNGSSTVHPETKKTIKDIFKPSTELEVVEGLKVGIYSEYKMGKTHFSLTAPLPIFTIDTEGAVRVNKLQFPRERQEQINVFEAVKWADKKTKKVDLVKSLEALEEAVDILTDYIVEMEEAKTPVFGTIVIDSATDIWEWLGVLHDDMAHGDEKLSRLTWGPINKKYRDFMYMLLKSQWNVIMTFRVKEMVTEKGATVTANGKPVLVPRWQKNTGYWLDVITELRWEGLTPVMHFRGDRFGRVTDTIEDATWPKMAEVLKKKSGINLRCE